MEKTTKNKEGEAMTKDAMWRSKEDALEKQAAAKRLARHIEKLYTSNSEEKPSK